MKPKKKPAVVRMLVVVPRDPELSVAEHRRAVRDALRHTADFYGKTVRVRGLAPGRQIVREELERARGVKEDGNG